MTQHRPLRRRRARLAAGFLAATALALAACGSDSDDGGGMSAGDGPTDGDATGGRTVEVEMADNEFQPARVEVAPGEPVRFVFSNEGEVTHDAVLGDEAAQAEHEDEMRAAEEADDEGMDDMGHGSEASDEGGAITVEPGDTGELTHTFAAGDELLIGCHEPGHYDAGMLLTVEVAEA